MPHNRRNLSQQTRFFSSKYSTMWKHYLKITQFYQKLYPQRVIYNTRTRKFESVHKPSKLYIWINAHVTQVSVAAFARCLYYLKTDSSENNMSFTDFIIDFLFWGIALICPASYWAMWTKKDNYSWFLNQAFNHRKIKGEFLANRLLKYINVNIML